MYIFYNILIYAYIIYVYSPSRRREAPCEGTNPPPGYLHPGKTKALAESKVHQISRAWVTVRFSVGGHPH
jgi:hypothetical protein